MPSIIEQSDARDNRINAVIELAKQLLVHQPEKYNIMHGGAIKDAVASATGIMASLYHYAKDIRNSDNDV